jgi:hypothetical protein
MVEIKLTIALLDDSFVICRLSPDSDLPVQSTTTGFYSITRTDEELSIVCTKENAPGGAKCDYGWRCFMVKGPLDFSLIGIMASISGSLANAGVSIFTISTFDTDYFLVKDEKLGIAIQALRDAGHTVQGES